MFSIKKIQLVSLFFCLFSLQSFAQDRFPQLRQKLDRVFAKIDKSQIPYGTLEENSFGFMNLWQMKRVGLKPYDTLQPIDHTAFRAAYATLETGKINTNYNLLPIDSLNERTQRYMLAHPDHNPIMLLYAGYSYLDSNAVSNNQFTVVNGQLRDVANRTKSPYLTAQFFAAAPALRNDTDGEVTFIFPRELFFSNVPVQTQAIFMVNFGNQENNLSWQPLEFDKPYTIRYNSKGMKAIAIRRLCESPEADDIAKTVIRVLNVPATASSRVAGGRTERYENQDLREFIIYNQPAIHEGGILQIRLSQNNNLPQPTGSVALRKPLIVAEGFDAYSSGDIIFGGLAIKNVNLSKFLSRSIFGGINLATENGFSLNDNLDLADYDLIYLDYRKGTHSIVSNASLFQEVLRWVNARKVANATGVREQNVVLGLSMGGLVARYGLAEMEKNRRAGIPDNDHEVRMLITHDSPHRGANLPLAYQSMVEAGRFGIWAGKLVPVVWELSDFLTAEANTQMLIYQTVPIGTSVAGNILYKKNTWIDDTYHPMVTFPDTNPAPYQFIALSNGSECGTRLHNPFVNLFTQEYSGFFSPIPWLYKPKFTTGIRMKTLPDRQIREIFRFGTTYTQSFFGGLIEIDMPVVNIRGTCYDDMLPIDGIAGGTKAGEIPFPDVLNNTDFSTPDWLWFAGINLFSQKQLVYTFVPKYSALDIRTDVPINEIVASAFHSTQTPRRSRADIFFTAPSGTSSAATTGGEFNQNHILFTRRNAEFIFSQMEPARAATLPPPNPFNPADIHFLPTMDCSSAICNPTQQIQSSLPSLCFGVNNVFSVSNLPTPVIVTWSASNTLVNITPAPLPNQVFISPASATSRGWVTITANINSVACNNFNQTLTKRIWVGEATNISLSGGVQNCNFVITANSAGSTNFEWTVDNPNVSPTYFSS